MDGLPVYFAVPENDLSAFRAALPSSVNVFDERDIMQRHWNKRLPGWRDQQVAKFMFGIKGPTDHYIILDSDSEFIRPFTASDFLPETGKIPLVITRHYYRYKAENRFSQDVALGNAPLPSVDISKYAFFSNNMFAIDRKMIDHRDLLVHTPTSIGPIIAQVFGRMDANPIFFMPTPIIWSKEVVEHFWHFLRDQGLSFSDLILYAPWEAMWYGYYALTRFRDRLTPREPLALHFISDADILQAKELGVTRETLSKNFPALTLAARHQEAEAF